MEFNKKAEKVFLFLVSEYGFNVVDEKENFIRYENNCSFLELYFDNFSYEVDVRIGLLQHEKDYNFNLPLIISALAQDSNEEKFFQCSDPVLLEKCLVKISDLIKKYCLKLFEGESSEWTKLSIEQQLESQKIFEQYDVIPIKDKAQKAWQEKRYIDVVELYSSIESYLTDAERKKLEYALKKVEDKS